jgi:hypothetical protein
MPSLPRGQKHPDELRYVDWFNSRRLHGTITPGAGYTTPAAHEAAFYRQTTPALEPATQ